MLSVMDGKYFWMKVKSYLTDDVNQEWLRRKIGITSSTMSTMITRGTMPKADVAMRISDALGVPMKELLGSYVTQEEFILTKMDKLAEQRKEKVIARGVITLEKDEEPTTLIPVVSQKISAGDGEDWLSDDQFKGHVRILDRMTRGIDKSTLFAAIVKGDSMTGVQIFDGDLVIFAQGHISENGIYVISLFGEVKVKRLEFRSLEQKVMIHSENPKYSTEEAGADNENLIILGKVVGWIHNHPY